VGRTLSLWLSQAQQKLHEVMMSYNSIHWRKEEANMVYPHAFSRRINFTTSMKDEERFVRYLSRGNCWNISPTPSGWPQLLPLSHKREPALTCQRARELNYTLRLRLPTMRLYARTMTAITRRRWMSGDAIWKASQPSNQSTTRTTTITHRIVPIITSTPFTDKWEHVGRQSLRGKKVSLP